jgi:hypothetical protein
VVVAREEARAVEDEPERPDADLGAGCDAEEVTAAAGVSGPVALEGSWPGRRGRWARGRQRIGRVAGSRSGADPLIDDMSAARRPSISVLATYRCQAWA